MATESAEKADGGLVFHPMDQFIVKPLFGDSGSVGMFTITNVNFSLGLYHHLAGGDPDDRWLLTIGLGYGF